MKFKTILSVVFIALLFTACDKDYHSPDEDITGWDTQETSTWNIQTEEAEGRATALNEKSNARTSDSDFYLTATNVNGTNKIILQRKSTNGVWYTYAIIDNSIAFAWQPITGQICSDYGQWRIKKYYTYQDDVQLRVKFYLDASPYDVLMQDLTTGLVGNDWLYLRTKDRNIHVQRNGLHIIGGGC